MVATPPQTDTHTGNRRVWLGILGIMTWNTQHRPVIFGLFAHSIQNQLPSIDQPIKFNLIKLKVGLGRDQQEEFHYFHSCRLSPIWSACWERYQVPSSEWFYTRSELLEVWRRASPWRCWQLLKYCIHIWHQKQQLHFGKIGKLDSNSLVSFHQAGFMCMLEKNPNEHFIIVFYI